MNVRANLEPFKDLKIEVNFDRTQSSQVQSFFVFNDSINAFREGSRREMGTFSMSYLSWGTAFGGSLENDKSAYFESFKEYRAIISQRVGAEDPRHPELNDSTGYADGYGPTSQYVLLPAFLAAYSGKGADGVSLTPFPTIPMPNWKISYGGLSKIPLLQQIFKSVTLNHSYRSTYNIGSFVSNLNFSDTLVGGKQVPNRKNTVGDYYPELEFANVTITEQFNPLINVDVTFLNSLMAKFEIKRSRNLSLSFSNNQLTELTSQEYIVGAGYRIKEFPISFSRISGGTGKTFKSDVNIKADFSIKNDKTVLRSIDSDLNQVSAGEKVTSMRFSIDYELSKSLTIELFFDKVTRNPFLPSRFRTSDTKGGIRLRFSLAQ
jgi:cell surface protein SprA